MELIVDRKWKKDTYTIGKWYADGVEIGNSLEDKDRGLDSSMPLDKINKIKVKHETAIPTGTYEIKMTYSPRFSSKAWGRKYNGKVPEILNVKGFTGVRIHPMNNASQSSGCIGIGNNNVKGMITNSTGYYYKLLDNYILPAINKGEKITLTIR